VYPIVAQRLLDYKDRNAQKIQERTWIPGVHPALDLSQQDDHHSVTHPQISVQMHRPTKDSHDCSIDLRTLLIQTANF
jgi:hypothetical protein